VALENERAGKGERETEERARETERKEDEEGRREEMTTNETMINKEVTRTRKAAVVKGEGSLLIA
jgi:hypothetical protein